jgi:hypothetical protein
LDSNSPVSQKAFDSRVVTFKFTSQLFKKSSTFLKWSAYIKKYEPNIVIYCNALFFKEKIYMKKNQKIGLEQFFKIKFDIVLEKNIPINIEIDIKDLSTK